MPGEYRCTGVLSKDDLLQMPSEAQLERGVAFIECVQEIPCNPCVDACPVHAISMKDINAQPYVDFDRCTSCMKCVGVCPGLAIFVIKVKGEKALVTIPYEFLPVPAVGDVVDALDREGAARGPAKVVRVVKAKKTMLVTVEVDRGLAMDVRHFGVRP
jgi:Fe-S-cluster-containing hydrogenase component 2